MKFAKAILTGSATIGLIGCTESSDPFAEETYPALESKISIQVPGQFEKPNTGLNAIIDKNGGGSFHFEGKMHKIGRAKKLYSEVTSLLGPLQNYSGNFEGVEDMNRKLECGDQSFPFEVALIFWNFDSDQSAQNENWKTVSQYDLSCNSKKSKFATDRIRAAIQKFEDHVEDAK